MIDGESSSAVFFLLYIVNLISLARSPLSLVPVLRDYICNHRNDQQQRESHQNSEAEQHVKYQRFTNINENKTSDR